MTEKDIVADTFVAKNPGGGSRARSLYATPLALIKTEYWDRAGGGGNISYDW